MEVGQAPSTSGLGTISILANVRLSAGSGRCPAIRYQTLTRSAVRASKARSLYEYSAKFKPSRTALPRPTCQSAVCWALCLATELSLSFRRNAKTLPDGQITSCFARMPVQPLLQKYFCSRLTQIRCISKPSRLDKRGGSRVVTNAGRDAVDARASGAQWQSQGEMNLVSGELACKMIGA